MDRIGMAGMVKHSDFLFLQNENKIMKTALEQIVLIEKRYQNISDKAKLRMKVMWAENALLAIAALKHRKEI